MLISKLRCLFAQLKGQVMGAKKATLQDEELNNLLNLEDAHKIVTYLSNNKKFDDQSLKLILAKENPEFLLYFLNLAYKKPDFPKEWINPILERVLDLNAQGKPLSGYVMFYDFNEVMKNNLDHVSIPTLMRIVKQLLQRAVGEVVWKVFKKLVCANQMHQVFETLKGMSIIQFRLSNYLLGAVIDCHKISELTEEELRFVLKDFIDHYSKNNDMGNDTENLVIILTEKQKSLSKEFWDFLLRGILKNENVLTLLQGINNTQVFQYVKNLFLKLDKERKVRWLKRIDRLPVFHIQLKLMLVTAALRDRDEDVTDLAKQIIKRLKD